MLNQINQTAPSFATVVEKVGSIPDFLASLEGEVEQAANDFGAEIIFLLIEKWEGDMELAKQEGRLTVDMLLTHYVGLKISLHHLRRRYERDWYYDLGRQHEVETRIVSLNNKVKDARRNYYVAKRRVEGEHGNDCSCRGCRCIKCISG